MSQVRERVLGKDRLSFPCAVSKFLLGHWRQEPSEAITVGQVSIFHLQRQTTLTYCDEI